MQNKSSTYELVSQRRDACHVTKIWKRIAPEPDTEEPYIPDRYLERKRQELDSLNEQIEAMTNTCVCRPPWGVGFTTQELMAIAKHERVNPYRYDWWDGIDSKVIKEARQGCFKRPTPSITELRHKRAKLKREIAVRV
jgi:hypothetical protein